uniref:Uncharacterized protein n=1 Tax=Kalanchoe fedtschenkoi TaxID=63787 RepID=A0A7N0UEI7_KALFE
MASYRQNLRKIGEEAFRLIDQAEEKQRFINHPTKPAVHYFQPFHVSNVHRADPLDAPRSTLPPLGQNGYHVQAIPDPVADRDDHGHAIDCYEAARRFGGIVVTDYYPKARTIVMQRNYKAYW